MECRLKDKDIIVITKLQRLAKLIVAATLIDQEDNKPILHPHLHVYTSIHYIQKNNSVHGKFNINMCMRC